MCVRRHMTRGRTQRCCPHESSAVVCFRGLGLRGLPPSCWPHSDWHLSRRACHSVPRFLVFRPHRTPLQTGTALQTAYRPRPRLLLLRVPANAKLLTSELNLRSPRLGHRAASRLQYMYALNAPASRTALSLHPSSMSSLSNNDLFPLAARAAQFVGPAVSISAAASIATLSAYTSPVFRAISAETSTRTALLQVRAFFKSGAKVYPTLAFFGAACSALCAWALPRHRTAYALSTTFALGIAPFTQLVMVPLANGRLIELHKRAAKGEFEGEKGNKEVDALLKKFEMLNTVRAAIVAVGGLVSLWAAMQ